MVAVTGGLNVAAALAGGSDIVLVALARGRNVALAGD